MRAVIFLSYIQIIFNVNVFFFSKVDGHKLDGMGNSEAIDMLRNTGPVVVLVVARIVGGNNQSLQRQKGLSREDLLQAVANDELYGI